MATGSSPELLRRLLIQIEGTINEMGVNIDAWFQPGLAEDEVRGRLEEVGLECPDELVVWFGWHNGYRTSGLPAGGPAFPNFLMGTLDDATARYRQSSAFAAPVSA